MSLDDTMVALQVFEAELGELTDNLAASLSALRRHHEQLGAVWRDEFARQYRQRWDSFEHHLDNYLRRDAPRYQAFLHTRIAALGRYLGDG
ncbi:MAG: hypothetical protein M3137_05160 [Actinomycetota bacterium]|nr:hypothetical protein [Actinomycetota bacterium]